MKINIPIELTDEERKTLGRAWHGKAQSITRKEVVTLVDELIHFLASRNHRSMTGSIGWTLNFHPGSVKLSKEN